VGLTLDCSDAEAAGGDCGEASREVAKKTVGSRTRMRLRANFATASPGRNARSFCEMQYC